jgi:ABC-type phosphate transport system ATPase subunit
VKDKLDQIGRLISVDQQQRFDTVWTIAVKQDNFLMDELVATPDTVAPLRSEELIQYMKHKDTIL